MMLAPVLGNFMAKVFEGKKHFLFFLSPIENCIYRLLRLDPKLHMDWKTYALCVLFFSILSFAVLFLILITQAWLPLNPQHLGNLSLHLAFNTAVSFMTNTNWQSYSGEITLSYFSQMLGLTVQNFVSAAVGMSCAVVLIRGIIHKKETSFDGLGNFFVDMTRCIIYILLPLSAILAFFLVSQGVIQNLNPYIHFTTIQGIPQTLPMGPAASQIAIKQLGSNGGGFFGVNSAHPFENPTPLSNFIELLSIIIIPAAFPFMFGYMSGKRKQGYVIFFVMLTLLVMGLFLAYLSEFMNGTMEGKEFRFGVGSSTLWSIITTATGSGSVNSMHDSFAPLTGMIQMFNIMLGEIIFGGVGSGFYGIIALIIITVFISGLMVGRSPEYMGKKIEALDVKLSMITIIMPAVIILIFSSMAVMNRENLSSLTNSGPHGLSEILYAYVSGAGNNGSAFTGLNANTSFYNITLGIDMLIGRFGIIFPILALAGNFYGKKIIPASEGTFRTDTFLFGVLLSVLILIIGGLTHFPALTLGPVIEHLMMK